MPEPTRPVTVAGAGLVGSLLATLLARRGFDVEVFERRPDMRKISIAAGRSINLAVSTRGLHALAQIGMREEILRLAIPMRGRMIHPVRGELAFQRYGRDDSECINSISRAGLNKALMTQAEKAGRVRIRFEETYESFRAELSAGRVVFGADGSHSAVRAALARELGPRFQCSEVELDYGYKELDIPAGPGGSFRLEKHALHIWPRGTFMLIALPNTEGTFTCTLFLPFRGTVSFEALDSPAKVLAFFQEQFPDAAPLIPDLTEAFFENPTGRMVTVKCQPWNAGGNTLLLGDAAHAIVPFFGQGMNAGFEDCTVLDGLLEKHGASPSHSGIAWDAIFSEFVAARKANTDAIADMAVENFVEMRDKVGDPRFLLEKAVERILQEKFPGEYLSRYWLVTFSRVPYTVALKAGEVQCGILAELCRKLDRPEDVDLERAGALIRERLRPVLADLGGK